MDPIIPSPMRPGRQGRMRLWWLAFGLVLLGALAPAGNATVYVNRSNQNDPNSVSPKTIFSNTTWSPGAGPYIIEDKVTILSSIRLTIQAGAEVQVKPEKGLVVEGEIVAAGVTFTRIGASGRWLGIYLSPASGASTIVNCTLDSAGSTTGFSTPHGVRAAVLYVDRCNPIIQGCTFSNPGNDGIELYDSNATVASCVFQVIPVAHFAILCETPNCFPVVSGNSWSGLTVNGIAVAGGTIYSGRWRKGGNNFPWIVRSNISVLDLTIDPGALVEVSGATINVSGELQAAGTSADHIVFTAYGRPQSTGGSWNGISFGGGNVGTLNYCEIWYAGAATGLGAPATGINAAVFVNSGTVSITNSIIANSETDGIELASAAGQFGGGPQVSPIKNCSFEAVAAGYYAIRCNDTDCFPDVSGNSATGSGNLGIGLAGGEITTGGLWRKGGADFPYILRGSVTVGDQHFLDISAGVRVEASNGSGITATGGLDATGTAAAPIVFTSGKAVPVPGDFGGIHINTSGFSSNIVYCHIEYASSPAVSVGDEGTDVTDNLILNPAGTGIQLTAKTANITGNTITNVAAGQYAFVFSSPDAFPNIANNTATGPGNLGVKLPGGTVNVNGTYQLPGTGLAYFLASDLTIANTRTVYVAPGNTFQVTGAGIYVNGVLHAVGTAVAPLTFTSGKTSPAPGDWEGIFIGATASGSEVEFSNVSYAGAAPNSGPAASLRAIQSSPDFDHVTLRHPLGHGILLDRSNSAIAACTFEDINGSAYAVYLDSPDCFPMCNNDKASGTGHLGIRAEPGTISNVNGFWRKAGEDFPWMLSGDFTVAADATLSIDQGVTVQVSGGGLYVNGALTASGSSAEPVRFTSLSTAPQRGDWKGIVIAPTATVSSLSWMDLEYGGALMGTYHGLPRSAALFIDGKNVTLANVRVMHSALSGIEMYGSGSTIRNSLIWDCSGAGISATGASSPGIHNCTVVDNGTGVGFTDSNPNLVNNIIALNTAGVSKTGVSSATLSYNNVYGNTTNYLSLPDPTGGNGNTKLDPLFANPGGGNFRLSYGSPCINSGNNAVVSAGATDLDANARILAATVDRGAYEFTAPSVFTGLDVALVLRVACGETAASVSDLARLNVIPTGNSAGRIDGSDAAALARKVFGTDANP